jgi:1,4-dihydroxy-2-naphthoyl-CoA synthase
MSSIALILALSAIIWYIVDRFKTAWETKAWGKYVTTGVAAVLGIAVVFGYNLDLVCALGMAAENSIVGQVLTVLSLMCGSSAMSEIIARIKGE